MNPNLPLAVAAALLFSIPIGAQCTDPATPQGGFALTRLLAQPVTYLDGAKTLMDVRYPSARPGPCGWPVLIVVHGLAGNRAQQRVNAELFASQGYMTVAYDVRGQGDALALNPPALGTELIGRSERLDLAEIVALIKSRFGKTGVADVNRLGIIGFSQGAAHSWAAAAWSGRTLPPNSRGITTFPTFKAAYPISLAPASEEIVAVGGNALSQSAIEAMLVPPALMAYEPTFHSAVKAALAKGDVAALTAILANDPWRQDLVHLQTSKVPVMVVAQWNDQYAPVELALRALDAMPKTTPTRAFLSTFAGHQSPLNVRQIAQGRSLALRWFDRFVKGIKNQVDTEPRFAIGAVPGSLAEYQNPSALLWHRYSATWAQAGTTQLAYFLRQGQALSPTAPAGAEAPETVRHRVTPGWNMALYVNRGGLASDLSSAFTQDSKVYDSPVLQDPIEILGSPRVELEVTPQASSTDYQLHCALYHVPAIGPERFLQSGVAVVTGNGKAQRLTVDIGDLDAFVPAGGLLRLRIENLSPRPLPGAPPARPIVYHTVPYFVDATVDVEHTAARPSRLVIPVAKAIQPALTSATLDVDTRFTDDVTFGLDGTARVAGGTYLVAFGTSGLSPGTPLPGETALLNIDAVTTGMFGLLNTPFLPNCAGILGLDGRPAAQPRLALSTLPSLGAFLGLRLNAIALVTAKGQMLASNPLDLFFR